MGHIEDLILTPLKVISVSGGDVLHAMKCGDPGYVEFGEAYFSTIDSGVVKAWKRHRQMTLNLVGPSGAVRLVIYDNRENSASCGNYQVVTLSRDNFCRLTVPPMVWMGFQGVDENTSMLLNIADIRHSPAEVDRKEMNGIKYDWEFIE